MQYSFGQVIDQQPVAWQIVHGKRVSRSMPVHTERETL